MLDPKLREVLQEARDLIADADHWCVTALARDAQGAPCPVDYSGAVQFCARGAVLKVNRYFLETADLMLGRAAAIMYGDIDGDIGLFELQGETIASIAHVNNLLGLDATLAVFDKVLADETLQ